jgi:glycosyltransferase involved in cell wall biosynthesis
MRSGAQASNRLVPERREELQKPRVTIVSPCFNCAEYLPAMAESVIAQSLTAWELIVVDDGSTDRSRAVAKEIAAADSRITMISQPNTGVAGARNAGLRAASVTSEFLLFLDADDQLHPDMLSRLVCHLDEHGHAGAVYCGWRYIDESGSPVELELPRLLPRYARGRLGPRAVPDHDLDTPLESILCAAGLTPSLMLIRRVAYQRTPGWDESFGQPAEDTLLFLELALVAPIHHLNAQLVDYRVHGQQSTASVARLGSQWLKLLDQWARYEHRPADQQAAIRRAWCFRERQYTILNAARRIRFEARNRRFREAVRFGGGAARIVLRSLIWGPPPRSRSLRP